MPFFAAAALLLLGLPAAADPPAVAVFQFATQVHVPGDGGPTSSVPRFLVTVGDPSREDEKSQARSRKFGMFALDCEEWMRADGGCWKRFVFRMPRIDGDDHDDTHEFLAYLRRPDVQAMLENPYEDGDFGQEGEFYVRRQCVPLSSLPPEFQRLTPETLGQVRQIFRHRADGSMNVFLEPPADQQPGADAFAGALRSALER